MNRTGVSEHALIQRINRNLAKQGLRLRKGRPLNPETGAYYIVESETGRLTVANVDPEALARELGALRKKERVHWAS